MIKNIYDIARINGGITYNVLTGEMNPKEGYMVSIEGHEQTTPILTPNGIIGYIGEKANVFSEEVYLGLWKADVWYFDVSILVRDRESAIRIAKQNNQKAIYDLNNKQDIEVEKETISVTLNVEVPATIDLEHTLKATCDAFSYSENITPEEYKLVIGFVEKLIHISKTINS